MRINNILLIISLTSIALSSCTKDNASLSSSYVKWQLIEQLADPGDGSGIFEPVTSQKILRLYSSGNFTSNGPMCTMSTSDQQNSSGTFTNDELFPENCINYGMSQISYQISDDTLIINYPCIEACAQKYLKID